MASPDEARVDEARDQSTVPASPSDPTPASGSAPVGDEPASAPQRRPRGAASFPGGPPPAAPAPAPADTPVAPPPRDDLPAARARSETTTRPTRQPSEAEGARTSEDVPTGDPTASGEAAPTSEAGRTRGPARARAATGETTDTTDTEDVSAWEGARTGGRRRRRGGRGRGAANPADTVERTGPDPGATEPAGPDAAPAVATTSAGLGGPSARDLAAEPTADGATPADPGATPADPGASQGELAPGGVGGSARTRARRRRRAAAKARGRDTDDDTTQPAEPGGGPATPRDETARPARAGRAASDEPSRGSRSRAAATADATLSAPASPGEPTDDQPAPAPTRTSRSRRRSGGGNGEAQQARPTADDPAQQARPTAGDPAQPADADPQAGGRPAGERGPGRNRRRGRGGGRLVAVDADTATEPADAPAEGDRAEAKEQGGQGRSDGSERSTRLETRSKREGARQADKGRRRRPSGLTEEQKRILREEGPDRRMVVTEGAERTQIGVLEGPTLVEHYVTRKAGRSMVGNIYLGRVQNVLPGMEAAFVDIGRGRNAVLYAGEVNYNEEDLDGEAPRIEKVLKAGQPVLVQVTKDPIGAKGARLTAQVSLAGRYLVLQPEDNTFGISRRLPE